MNFSARTGKAPRLDVVLFGEITASSPDIVLRLAVLERAIRDIIDHNQCKRCADAAAKRQAWAWFNSNARNQSWFTFIEVCEDIGLNYHAVRRKIFAEINTPDFLDRFELTQGATICGLRRTGRQRVVRYSKTDRLERVQKDLSLSISSAEETSDLLPCVSSLCAAEKSRSNS